MKLPIKKKYFDQIKIGKKQVEFRDAHITFVCEETKEELRIEVSGAKVSTGKRELYPDVLSDENTLVFFLEDN